MNSRDDQTHYFVEVNDWEAGPGAEIEHCDGVQGADDACHHCAMKSLIANVACAWAFDHGTELVDAEEAE